MSGTTRAMEALFQRDGATARAQHTALLCAGDETLPAWSLGPRALPLAESGAQSLLLLANALAGALADLRHPARGFEASMRRPLNALEAAHARDNEAACAAVHRMLAVAQGVLAQARLGAGGAYLSCAAAVLQVLEAMCGAVYRGIAARSATFGDRVAQYPFRSTLVQHATCIGAMPPAMAHAPAALPALCGA